MSDTLRGQMPAIYAHLLPGVFDEGAVVESRATCHECDMCNKGTMPDAVVAIYFDPDLKCCTFHPSLPNFLAGAILSDPRPEIAEGRRRLEAHIATRIGVTPRWVGPSAKWEMLYNASADAAFGRSSTLRCPYLDGGRCSIWQHRESVCSTFFCKYVGGMAGAGFWKALKSYLSYVEEGLAQYAARKVAPDVVEPPQSHRLTREELEDRPPEPATYRSWWKGWVGREAEFYRACHAAVAAMDRDGFARMIDESARGRELLATVEERRAALAAPKVPERLALHARLRALPVGKKRLVVVAPYNPYDSFLVERELLDVMKVFDHDTTVEEARARLLERDGIELEDALLDHLVRHAFLVGPPPGGVCQPTPARAASVTRSPPGPRAELG